MKSVLTKLFGIYVITILVLIFIIFFFSFNRIRENTINNLNVQLSHLNKTIVLQAEPYILTGNYRALDSLVKVIGHESESRITIILRDGTVVADNEKDPKTLENHSDRPEIIDARSKGSGGSLRFSYSIHQKMLYNAVRVIRNNEIIAYSRVSLPIKYLDDLYYDLTFKILSLTVVVFILALILLFIFSGHISKNINKIVKASNKIAEGNFDSKVYLNTSDELSILGNNFNNMADKLKDLFTEVNKKQEEIASIIKSMRDGIIVIDSHDKIVLCNENFKSYFNIPEINGNYYWEIIRDMDFQKLIKKIQSSRESRVAEIYYRDNYYLASASWNDLKKEVVVIVYDINEMKRLEVVKRDFITNVSHELKTPLTAIKGFVETMQDGADDEQKYYLSIIERQTQRLILIVQDLLLLAKLENPDTRIHKKDVRISEVCDNIFKLFEDKAVPKNVSLIKQIPPEVIINADEYMLEQILINLVENALKYTDSGSITVSVDKIGGKVALSVTDTGIGIPKEHLPRIFERFYTVDKSHSKAISGTGLGLSIVKRLSVLHDAEITCESTVGKGTKFTVIFQ